VKGISKKIFAVRLNQPSPTGLVQQTVQIVASHDLTLIVRGFHFNACATAATAPTTVAIVITTLSQNTFVERRSFESEFLAS